MDVEPVVRVLRLLGALHALIGRDAMAARGYPRPFAIDVDLLTSDKRVLELSTWAELERAHQLSWP